MLTLLYLLYIHIYIWERVCKSSGDGGNEGGTGLVVMLFIPIWRSSFLTVIQNEHNHFKTCLLSKYVI